MDEMIIKYAFFYGPLMIFFFAVGWAVKQYTPPLFAAWSNMLRETVAALSAAALAMNNQSRALDTNSEALVRHAEATVNLRALMDDLKEAADGLQCPHVPPRRRGPVTKKTRVQIVSGTTS